MTKEELIEHLIINKQVIQIGEQYFVKGTKNNKLFCKNLPEKYIGVSLSKAYDFFLNDCEIPLNGSIESKQNSLYLLRSKTKESEAVFKNEILYNPEIDYVSLTNNIKSFYKKSTTKYTVVRLLTEGFWKGFINTKINNDEFIDNM
jgi:hypothetical protein